MGGWLQFAERRYAAAGAAFGQVATNAHDEALYLLLHTLGLPLDSGPEVLARRLGPAEAGRVEEVFRRRLADRVPAAYLTREAWLGEHRFYVDERVIIPRSYFLEIIPQLKIAPPAKVERVARGPKPWRRPLPNALARPRGRTSALGTTRSTSVRIADLCTGSGCLAILLAHQFPEAEVDAVDISPAALAVARINVRAHGMTRRVHLWQGDVFAGVPAARYDLIVSNPPYEPSARMAALPAEFRKEPRLALDGGGDGLDVIRRILAQAKSRVAPGGRLLIEVGGLQAAIDREFAALKPRWLETADGSNCVCEFTAARLR